MRKGSSLNMQRYEQNLKRYSPAKERLGRRTVQISAANGRKTETDRPIIWVCHDIGGTIVKEVFRQTLLREIYTQGHRLYLWELHTLRNMERSPY
jgi:hypothetical protein